MTILTTREVTAHRDRRDRYRARIEAQVRGMGERRGGRAGR